MTQPLTLNEFKMLAKNARQIAVSQEIPAGKLTPVIIYSLLNKAFKTDGVILEDLDQRECARYSFICFEPTASLTINNDDNSQPLAALRDLQSKLAYSTRAEVADLITSAIGFITYDVVRHFETIPDRHAADPSLPILLFNFYALSMAFDHEKQTILISTLVEVSDPPEQAYHQARQKIMAIIKLLFTSPHEADPSIEKKATSHVEVDISDSDFMRMVEKAKDYIIRGDAFQIVISRCFKRNYSVSPLEIYTTLRRVSPAPFMFYFPTEASVIIGASPERFIRVHNKQVTVNPIAGTRKHTGETTDEAISADLLNDKKELAEHMMLVDLARNDVGAVSNPASVQVRELLHVKHYSHVSHITSTVSGQLQEKYHALDAFAAAFPAATLSGAPKIRAMQIIDELETSRRGLYGGAICRLDSLGNLDSCIAIRMAVLQNGIATIRTGAGIVYDSNPADEAQETHQKARSMLDAIAQAHGE
jgi:anthranilate synthase component I